jgi:hypothetical protein
MNAHQRTFRKERRERCQLASIGITQKACDALARRRREPIALGIYEYRHVAIEPIMASEDTHPGEQLQIDDAACPLQQLRLADLEQLVARERVEDIGKRLVGVPAGGETGLTEDVIDLVAQERINCAGWV